MKKKKERKILGLSVLQVRSHQGGRGMSNEIQKECVACGGTNLKILQKCKNCETAFCIDYGVDALRERIKALEAVVEFYADPAHWTSDWVEGSHGDYGNRAREALKAARSGE